VYDEVHYEKLFIYNEQNKVSDIRKADSCISSTWIELIPNSKPLAFVTYMFENIQSKVLKKLLKIALLKREYISLFVEEKLITGKDFLNLDDYIRFKYWMMTSPNDDVLYHRLFDTSLIPNSAKYVLARNNFIK